MASLPSEIPVGTKFNLSEKRCARILGSRCISWQITGISCTENGPYHKAPNGIKQYNKTMRNQGDLGNFKVTHSLSDNPTQPHTVIYNHIQPYATICDQVQPDDHIQHYPTICNQVQPYDHIQHYPSILYNMIQPDTTIYNHILQPYATHINYLA